MDSYRGGAFGDVSLPLALQDFLAHKNRPSFYVYRQSSQSTGDSTAEEGMVRSSPIHAIIGNESGAGHQLDTSSQSRQQPAIATKQPEHGPATPSTPLPQEAEERNDGGDAGSAQGEGPDRSSQTFDNSIDWLAMRMQLQPTRNLGTKGAWVRGWSESISAFGDETYCACSTTVTAVGSPLLAPVSDVRRRLQENSSKVDVSESSGMGFHSSSSIAIDFETVGRCSHCGRALQPSSPASCSEPGDGCDVDTVSRGSARHLRLRAKLSKLFRLAKRRGQQRRPDRGIDQRRQNAKDRTVGTERGDAGQTGSGTKAHQPGGQGDGRQSGVASGSRNVGDSQPNVNPDELGSERSSPGNPGVTPSRIERAKRLLERTRLRASQAVGD